MNIITNIKLSDYNYVRDMNNRILLATLEFFETEILREILDHSLKIPLKQLIESLSFSEKQIHSTLEKLLPTELFTLKQTEIHINKEQRRYFENQITKFEDNFEPGLDHLSNVFNKIPIHVLLEWYDLPSTVDHVFQAIIKKYFASPRIYENYLNMAQYEHPWVKSLVRELYQSPNYEVDVALCIKKNKISKEAFHEEMLKLEFRLICCLAYRKNDSGWKEVVVPFQEWRNYLKTLQERQPKPIANHSPKEEWMENKNFIDDLSSLLNLIKPSPWPINQTNGKFFLQSDPNALFKQPAQQFHNDISTLVNRLLVLQLAKIEDEHLVVDQSAQTWLKMSTIEKSSFLQRYWLKKVTEETKVSVRGLNEIEKSLGQLEKNHWYFFDEFILSLTAPIGNAEPISLKNQGKKWCYSFSNYGPDEVEIVESILFGMFHEAGRLIRGSINNKKCFKINA